MDQTDPKQPETVCNGLKWSQWYKDKIWCNTSFIITISSKLVQRYNWTIWRETKLYSSDWLLFYGSNVIQNGLIRSEWLDTVQSSPKRFSTNWNGSKGAKMAQYCPKRSEIVWNSLKLSEMLRNAPKWSKMIWKSPKWSEMVHLIQTV
jgi:hypothetical protein